ncbi:hypothetical protein D3C79_1001720 [compost metagenome]
MPAQQVQQGLPRAFVGSVCQCDLVNAAQHLRGQVVIGTVAGASIGERLLLCQLHKIVDILNGRIILDDEHKRGFGKKANR